MNETIKKARNHIQKQKIMYLFLGLVLLLGIIVGICFLFLVKGDMKVLLDEEITHFFSNMRTLDNLSYSSCLIESISTSLFFVLLIFLLGVSLIGLPFILILLFMKGFILGFSISSIVSIYQFKGVLGAFLYLFPHQFIFVFTSVLITFYAVSFSIKLFSYLFLKKNINLKEAMQKYMKILLLSCLMNIFGSFLEVFLNPYLLQFFTKMI